MGGVGWGGFSVTGLGLDFLKKDFNLHRVLLFTFSKKHSGSKVGKDTKTERFSLFFLSVMSKHGSFYL